jgi:hypothetical protein
MFYLRPASSCGQANHLASGCDRPGDRGAGEKGQDESDILVILGSRNSKKENELKT